MTPARTVWMLHLPIILILATIVVMTSRPPSPASTDTLFVNARIHVMDDGFTTASAMFVHDGKIVECGARAALEATHPAAGVVDLGGADVFPGFIDAHAHLFGLGEEGIILHLQDTRSPERILDMVRERVRSAPKGAWIRGRGWDQNLWPVKEFPDHRMLDAAAPEHPVFLQRVDGHAVWVNTRALEAAHITSRTPDPNGGRILRDAAGEPTGVLLDNAIELVRGVIPLPSPEERAKAYEHAISVCLAKGMTGMHDMGIRHEDIPVLRHLIESGRFPFRVAGYVDGVGNDWEQLLKDGRHTFGADQFTLAGLKLYADGALGSRGALLAEDYADDPGNHGLQLVQRDSLVYDARRAIGRGLQVCVHAIGDAANTLVLDAYEEALAGTHPAHPLRIEHVQVLRPQDVPRFAQLGVIPSMQPTHCTSDMRWAERRLGPVRVRGAYAWRSVLDAGAWIPGGSDFPVERPDPIAGMHAACTRTDALGRPSSQADIDTLFTLSPDSRPDAARYEHGWYGAQRMTRAEAVRAFTVWAARAAGMDALVGSLQPGRYADFVVVSQDLLTVPDDRMLATRVLSTWHAGRKVWSAGGGMEVR